MTENFAAEISKAHIYLDEYSYRRYISLSDGGENLVNYAGDYLPELAVYNSEYADSNDLIFLYHKTQGNQFLHATYQFDPEAESGDSNIESIYSQAMQDMFDMLINEQQTVLLFKQTVFSLGEWPLYRLILMGDYYNDPVTVEYVVKEAGENPYKMDKCFKLHTPEEEEKVLKILKNIFDSQHSDENQIPLLLHHGDEEVVKFFKINLTEESNDGLILNKKEREKFDPAQTFIQKSVHKIIKQDSGWEGLVYGVVYAPNEVDAHDDFALPEDIESAAHSFMKTQTLNLGHYKDQELTKNDAQIVESFIAPIDFVYDGSDQTITKGSWVLVTQVYNEDIKDDVIKGEFAGWSLEGLAERVEV